jgi:hypothetical protein
MRKSFDPRLVIFLGVQVKWSVVTMEKSCSCCQFWTILPSACDNMPQNCPTEKVFVETLLCRERDHPAKSRPGKFNPKDAFLGGGCAPNSSRPRNVGLDPQRCPRIFQIHSRLISGVDIRQVRSARLSRKSRTHYER